MKPRLLPVHLEEHPSESFRDQLGYLEGLTGELVEWLEPAHIDDQVPAGTSAVVVPDLSGRAYRGWPVDPDGLCDLLLQLSDEYPQTPLLITENGAAYPDTVGADGRVDDPRRVAYFDIDHPGGDDRSRDFYRGVLGFEELDAGDFERGRRRTCWFASGPALLKVVEIGEKGDVGSWVDDDLQAGMRHAGFKVGDVDEQVRRLEAAGVEVLSPPRDVLGDVRIAFFLDPDGARLEYIQGNLRYEHVESPPLVQAEVDRGLAPGDGPRFDHVGLTVADLTVALDFWCGRLGYEVIGDIRHHDDERGFLMTYLQAGDSVLEVFSFEVPTFPSPVTSPTRLGLRGLGLAAEGVSPGDTALLDPEGVEISLVATDA